MGDVVSSVIGGFFGMKASENAADAQLGAANAAARAQMKMFNLARKDQAPWRKEGGWAINKLGGPGGLIAKGPGRFIPEKEPGYRFGYEQFVENPTLRLASATGKLGSGATMKALTRYASDYASTKYDNFLDRYYKSLDPYFRTAGLGSNVAMAGGNQAVNTGQGLGLTSMAGGEAKAAGYLGSAYPWTQLANTAATNFAGSPYSMKNMLGSYFPSQSQYAGMTAYNTNNPYEPYVGY